MDQKIENQLNLAINIPEDERVRTRDLDTGYNMTENEWELIVKYNGNIETAAMNIADSLKILLGGYALVRIKQERIDEFAALREVIYIEKPKKLYFELENSGSVSCLDFQYTDSALDGSGVITAIIDSSVDYRHPDFMTEEGKTRIIELYDENTGRVYSEDDINAAIGGDLSRVPVEDVSGHGTHVAGIAAGNGRASNGRYRGVAYKSRLLIVKLGNDLYFSSARLMEALDYVIRKAASLSMPVAINMSFGNNYGAHDGTSLLETYINAVADIWQCVIVAGSGNEATRKIHVMHDFAKAAAPVISTELVIGRYEPSIDIQIWKNYADIYRITLTAPDGRRYGPVQGDDVITVFRAGSTEIYVYFGQPSPYSVNQEIFIQMIGADYISSGIWIIEAEALDVRDDTINFIQCDNGRSIQWTYRFICRFLGTGIYKGNPHRETGYSCTGSKYYVTGTGRWIFSPERYIHGSSVCDRHGSTSYAMGYCKRHGSVYVRSQNKSTAHTRSCAVKIRSGSVGESRMGSIMCQKKHTGLNNQAEAYIIGSVNITVGSIYASFICAHHSGKS